MHKVSKVTIKVTTFLCPKFSQTSQRPRTRNPFATGRPHFAHTVSQSSFLFFSYIYFMDNMRRRKIGIESTPGTQFLSHWITDNTIGLTREDYLCQRSLQIALRTRIEEVAKKIAAISESSEGHQRINPIIEEYVISEKLFRFLLEEERLPETINNKKIVYELVNYRLLVRVMPSACHEYTAACFNEDIFLWAASGGVTRSLRNGNGACTQLILRLVNFTSVSMGGGLKKIPRQLIPSKTYPMPTRPLY